VPLQRDLQTASVVFSKHRASSGVRGPRPPVRQRKVVAKAVATSLEEDAAPRRGHLRQKNRLVQQERGRR
jgi:hypothetical protein